MFFRAFRERRYVEKQIRRAAIEQRSVVGEAQRQLLVIGQGSQDEIRRLCSQVDLPDPRCERCGSAMELCLGKGATAYWRCKVGHGRGVGIRYIDNGNRTPVKDRKPARVRWLLEGR